MNGKYVLKLRFKFNYFLTEVRQRFGNILPMPMPMPMPKKVPNLPIPMPMPNVRPITNSIIHTKINIFRVYINKVNHRDFMRLEEQR